MLKRKPLLFLTFIFAIVALFATPAVMAEWPKPPSIYDINDLKTATIAMPKGGT